MIVTQEQFQILKDRYKKYASDEFPGIDQEMVPVVTRLAAMDDVVPIWCCGGHYGDTQLWGDKTLLKLYILMAVKDMNGLIVLYKIINEAKKRMKPYLGPDLHITQLQWGFTNDFAGEYPAINLVQFYKAEKPQDEAGAKIKILFALSSAIDYVRSNLKSSGYRVESKHKRIPREREGMRFCVSWENLCQSTKF